MITSIGFAPMSDTTFRAEIDAQLEIIESSGMRAPRAHFCSLLILYV